MVVTTSPAKSVLSKPRHTRPESECKTDTAGGATKTSPYTTTFASFHNSANDKYITVRPRHSSQNHRSLKNIKLVIHTAKQVLPTQPEIKYDKDG